MSQSRRRLLGVNGELRIGESLAGQKPEREIAGNGKNPAHAVRGASSPLANVPPSSKTVDVLGFRSGPALAGGGEPSVKPDVTDEPCDLLPQEVPRSEWPYFFAGVSRLHQGWPVSLHVFEAKSRPQNNWKTRQFAEIGLATRNGGKAPISIVLTDPRKKVTRTIAAPVRVWFLDKLGADAVIAIEAGQQSAVMLRFHSPALSRRD